MAKWAPRTTRDYRHAELYAAAGVKKFKAGICVLHFAGVGWTQALCGAVRRHGHLLLTIGADCPNCLAIKSAAAEPQKEASDGL